MRLIYIPTLCVWVCGRVHASVANQSDVKPTIMATSMLSMMMLLMMMWLLLLFLLLLGLLLFLLVFRSIEISLIQGKKSCDVCLACDLLRTPNVMRVLAKIHLMEW